MKTDFSNQKMTLYAAHAKGLPMVYVQPLRALHKSNVSTSSKIFTTHSFKHTQNHLLPSPPN